MRRYKRRFWALFPAGILLTGMMIKCRLIRPRLPLPQRHREFLLPNPLLRPLHQRPTPLVAILMFKSNRLPLLRLREEPSVSKRPLHKGERLYKQHRLTMLLLPHPLRLYQSPVCLPLQRHQPKRRHQGGEVVPLLPNCPLLLRHRHLLKKVKRLVEMVMCVSMVAHLVTLILYPIVIRVIYGRNVLKRVSVLEKRLSLHVVEDSIVLDITFSKIVCVGMCRER